VASLSISLQQLIDQLDSDLADQDPLTKIAEARQRARTMTAIGDRMIDHYVSRARAHGVAWNDIGKALGVTRQAAQQRSAPVLSRLADQGRRVLLVAQERARHLRHGHVGTEHLLLGVLADHDGLGGQILADLAGDFHAVERRLMEGMTKAAQRKRGSIPFTTPAREALQAAATVADDLEADLIGCEHLLYGLARTTEGLAARVLSEFNVTSDRIHTEIKRRSTSAALDTTP
jgi:cell division septum initiation protein DivIVA